MAASNVRGVDFYYRELGSGAPVLLVHGAAGIPVGDLVGFAYEGGEQGLVAEIVHDARNAATVTMDGS